MSGSGGSFGRLRRRDGLRIKGLGVRVLRGVPRNPLAPASFRPRLTTLQRTRYARR